MLPERFSLMLFSLLQVVVEKWVTVEEYNALSAARKLSWQISFEEEEREKKLAASAAIDGDTSMGDASLSALYPPKSSQAIVASKERGIYYSAGVGTPLRTHAALSSSSRLPSSTSLTSLAKLTTSPSLSKLSASPSSTSLATGRLRLPTGVTSSPRQWSANHAKRLVEDEAEGRRERDRRRKASVLLGGEEEVQVVEVATGGKKEEGKIKLADYTLTALAAEKGKGKEEVKVRLSFFFCLVETDVVFFSLRRLPLLLSSLSPPPLPPPHRPLPPPPRLPLPPSPTSLALQLPPRPSRRKPSRLPSPPRPASLLAQLPPLPLPSRRRSPKSPSPLPSPRSRSVPLRLHRSR